MSALGHKWDPVDLSFSPTPPKMMKEDNNNVSNLNTNPIASSIEYYRMLSSKLGTKAKYEMNEEIVFFLPAFAAIGHYVDRIGIVSSCDCLGNYRVIDKKDPCMRYTVNWNLICKTEQANDCNSECIQSILSNNDYDSANVSLAVAVSPIPSSSKFMHFCHLFVQTLIVCHLLLFSDRILRSAEPSKKQCISRPKVPKRGTNPAWNDREDAILLRLYNQHKNMNKYANSTKKVFISDLHKAFIKESTEFPRSDSAIRSRLHTLKKKKSQNQSLKMVQAVKSNAKKQSHKDDVSSESESDSEDNAKDGDYDNAKHRYHAYSKRTRAEKKKVQSKRRRKRKRSEFEGGDKAMDVKCECGKTLILRKLKFNETRYCDECVQKVGKEYYHCPDSLNPVHIDTYDICKKCIHKLYNEQNI